MGVDTTTTQANLGGLKQQQAAEDSLTVAALASFQKSPFAFIEEALGEVPQPIKEEFKAYVLKLYVVPAHQFSEYAATIRAHMFEPFEKGKHLTWQQAIFVIAVQRAVNGSLPPRIAVKAGRGTGKSNIMSKLILWYLFSFPLSRIPCTAPTSDQLFAVLWSEINLTLSNMKPEFADMFEWSSDFVRIKQHPQVWYARAKTAGKGQTGALSGIHADYMASFADESYDIEDDVFQVAEATQTGDKSLMILVGNAVHDHGYFYDCFNANAENWINITMNAEESPIVNQGLIADQKKTYGENSNHYRASILGEFPIATAIDVDGWRRLFTDSWIDDVMVAEDDLEFNHLFADDLFRRGRSFLGVDPSGEGSDESVGYIRNQSAAKIVFHNATSSIRGCALSVIGTINTFALDGGDVTCDNFGVGAELSQEVMIQSNSEHVIDGRNTGDRCEDILDQATYMNERARMYDALYWWGKRGGKILYDDILAKELKTIFIRETEQGKKQIMPKREMRKRGFPSPNRADAICYTTLNDRMLSNYIPRADFKAVQIKKFADKHNGQQVEEFDRFNSIPSV